MASTLILPTLFIELGLALMLIKQLLFFVIIIFSETSLANSYDVRICTSGNLIINEKVEIDCSGSKKTIKDMYRSEWTIKFISEAKAKGEGGGLSGVLYSIVFEKKINK